MSSRNHAVPQSRRAKPTSKWDHYDLTSDFEAGFGARHYRDGRNFRIQFGEQWRAAAQQHPALKAIFGMTPVALTVECLASVTSIPEACFTHFPTFWTYSARFTNRGHSGELPPEQEELWKRAMQNF